MLALTGGVLGLALAQWSVKSLVALNPQLAARVRDRDRRQRDGVHAGRLGASRACCSAWRRRCRRRARIFRKRSRTAAAAARRISPDATCGAGSSSPRSRCRSRCLIGAGLLIKSVGRLQGVDPGLRPAQRARLQPRVAGGKVSDGYGADSVRRPAAAQAERADRCEGGGGDDGHSVRRRLVDVQLHDREACVVPKGRTARGATFAWRHAAVSSRRCAIPLKQGRAFTDMDGPGSPPVAIVDQQLVKKYFANVDPIGKRITFGARRGKTDSTWITIVGVVGHAAHEGLDAEPRIQYYFPYRQSGGRGMTVAIRTDGPSAGDARRGARRGPQHRSRPAAVEREHDGQARRRRRSASASCR